MVPRHDLYYIILYYSRCYIVLCKGRHWPGKVLQPKRVEEKLLEIVCVGIARVVLNLNSDLNLRKYDLYLGHGFLTTV